MAAPLQRLSAIALTLTLTGLCGCGLLDLQSLTGSHGKVAADYTGNYAIAGVPSTSGQPPGPVQALLGSVANTGFSFSATFRLVSANACVAPSTDVLFTGSMDNSGQITLSSATLPNNPISITWLDDPTQSSNGVGTYTIAGPGPCAMASTQFVSDAFSPVTGTYTGAFTSTTGAPATITATLSQGAANLDGQFPETGSLTLATSSCTSNLSVNGIVTGPTLTAAFNSSGGATLGGFAALLPDHVLALTIPSGITVLGACNPGSYSGVLSKQ